ncbi:MAG: HTTM domain-containing protein [Thermomicrobiales bacterium]
MDIFGADLRSLALLRIMLAVIVIMDTIGRGRYLVAHYTDEGVLPRRDLLLTLNQWRWSLNLTNGTAAFQQLLFGITIAGAVALLVGYRTRPMSIVVWVLITSIQVRNPDLLSAADTLLRLLLFWCMFLPLGVRWSIDEMLDRVRPGQARQAPRATHALSFATAGIFLQIAFMYWFTAMLKDSSQWRSEGTALYYALGARDVTTSFGNYLHQFPDLLRVLTFGSLGLEILAPILLFCPIRTGPIRTIAVFSIVGFHAGIWLTMNVGIFPWTSALCMACFLPSWFWDTALPRLRLLVPANFHPQHLRDRLATLGPIPGVATIHRGTSALFGSRAALSMPSSTVPGALEQMPAPAAPRGGRIATGTASTSVLSATASDIRRILATNPLVNVACCFLLIFVFFWNVSTVSSFQMPPRANLWPTAWRSTRTGACSPHARSKPPSGTSWRAPRRTARKSTSLHH